ncbi:hypothetical protein [Micromonospora sp. NPDC051296]|uniref:hypothetical protein n=1 Tax=Micromonospora sp. NPDC051296 TaxID=3155046 RepID=UPI003412FFA1
MTTREPWRILAAATGLAAVLALAACTGDGRPTADAPAPTGRSAEAGPATGFAGLYLTSDVVPVSESETQVVLASGRSCRDLSGMLVAGQWRLVDRLSFGKLSDEEVALLAGFGGIPGDLLQRGDRLVFAGLEGGVACTATVVEVARGEITIEGKGLPGTSSGWVAATRCYRSKADGALTVSLYFDTDDKVGGQGQIVLNRAGDRYQVDDDASALTLALLRHKGRFLGSMSAAYADLRRRPAGLSQLGPGGSFAGSATLRPDPDETTPAGVIDLAGLVDGDGGGGRITLSLPFSCPTVIEIK